jgi:glyoxylase-like metal-dependent hydrolase (beta-lactamase superfamily II)
LAETWELAEGVEVVELDGDVELPVRCFLLKEDEKRILVDTGYGETVPQLLNILEKRRLSSIVLTHLHIDHSGGALAVKKAKNIPIIYHRLELETLNQAINLDKSIHRMFADVSVDFLQEALHVLKVLPAPDFFAEDGMAMSMWRLMHTPGHTPGHVILVGENHAITGDLILVKETSNVAYVPLPGYHPLRNYLESLVKVASLDVEMLVPSHGPLIKDPMPRVREIFSHHRERLRQAASALEKGRTSIREVAEEIRWSKGSFSSLTPLDKWLALLETISHLDFLAETGYAIHGNSLTYTLSNNPDWRNVEQKLEQLSNGIYRP